MAPDMQSAVLSAVRTGLQASEAELEDLKVCSETRVALSSFTGVFSCHTYLSLADVLVN